MSATDRFGGHASWERACEAEDEAYAALIEGKTCLDCARCVKSDRYPCGFCTVDGEMRYEDDVPEEAGFECFEEAA